MPPIPTTIGPPHVSRLLYGLASFVIIIAGMRATAELLGLLFFSILLALTFTPAVEALMRAGLGRGAAVLLAILLVLIGGVILSLLMGASVSRLIGQLPEYEPRIAAIRQNVRQFVESHGLAVSDVIGAQSLSPSHLVSIGTWFLSLVGQAISTSLLVLILVAMMLVEGPALAERLPQRGQDSFASRFAEVGNTIKRYVAITGWLGLLNAVLNLALLLSLRVDAPLLWAVLSFLLCFVPVIGNLLALTPPAIMALLEFGWERALVVVIGYIVINNVIDYAVRPRFLKHGVSLSPLAIVISLLFWGWVLGPVGIVVAVPLTILLRKLILEHFRETRALASMLGVAANRAAGRSQASADEPAMPA